MAYLQLHKSESTRVALDKAQGKAISKLYSDAAKHLAEEAKTLSPNTSGALRKQQITKLKRQLTTEVKAMNGRLSGTIKDNMSKMSEAVVEDSKSFLKTLGMPVEGAFSRVPADVVESLVSGKLYAGDWSLSNAIWGSSLKTQSDVERIVALGTAENKSALAIAKDLEKYVDPSAKKDWAWSKVYPGTATKVDYNAQRLARTMVSHAYQQSLEQTVAKNPFVDGFIWRASGGARTCDLCFSRDGEFFKKGDLPLDHPNGMCTFLVEIPDLEKVAELLGDWVHGNGDAGIDAFAESMGGVAQQVAKNLPFDPKAWLDSLKGNASARSKWWVSEARDLGQLPYDEMEALVHYTGNGFETMNGFLRGTTTDGVTSYTKTECSYLNSALGKFKTSEPLVVRRGANLDVISSMTGVKIDYTSTAKDLNKMVGCLGTDKGFLSTSPYAEGGFTYKEAELIISLPKGTHGVYVESVTLHKGEKEFLVNSDSAFRVKGWDKGGEDGKYRVFMEKLPD